MSFSEKVSHECYWNWFEWFNPSFSSWGKNRELKSLSKVTQLGGSRSEAKAGLLTPSFQFYIFTMKHHLTRVGKKILKESKSVNENGSDMIIAYILSAHYALSCPKCWVVWLNTGINPGSGYYCHLPFTTWGNRLRKGKKPFQGHIAKRRQLDFTFLFINCYTECLVSVPEPGDTAGKKIEILSSRCLHSRIWAPCGKAQNLPTKGLDSELALCPYLEAHCHSWMYPEALLRLPPQPYPRVVLWGACPRDSLLCSSLFKIIVVFGLWVFRFFWKFLPLSVGLHRTYVLSVFT
jgi:hypothetical protein